MRTRCYNPHAINYANYGGRGITVCDEWRHVGAFRAWALAHGYDDTLLIDRIDPNGPYSPDNCRWVSRQMSNDNRRNVQLVTAWGETKTIKAWARDPRCQASMHTLYRRIRAGVPPEMAITTSNTKLTKSGAVTRHVRGDKCRLRGNTNGSATDHRRKWQACAMYQPREAEDAGR